MRTIINDTDGFKTIIEKNEVMKPKGYTQIRFITEWAHAKRDGSEQVQYELVVSPEELKALKSWL